MENNTATPVRRTHTATAADTLVHAYNPVNDTLRCHTTTDFVRLGRNGHDTVTCTACYADLTRLRTR